MPKTIEEFDDLISIFLGMLGWPKLLKKFALCFEGYRFENNNKKIHLITRPKFGGDGGSDKVQPKDLFFSLP